MLTPHYPIGQRHSNLLMVVSVVTAIDNILMGHIGLTDFKNLARQFKELSKNVNCTDYC